MSSTSANVRNLNESRAQALQALQSVTERLGDILGDTDLPEDNTRRNKNGDLVNEDGLPIIDITEPIDDLDTPSLSAATEDDEVIEEDNYPEPISKLSPEGLAVSRKYRDKILDLLEQEEAREKRKSQQEHQLEMTRKREGARVEMEKRMLNQGLDLQKRREAKELEKKMARALISGLGEPDSMKSKVAVTQADGKTKKVVTFADPPSTSSGALPSVTQQDFVPAKLPASKGHVTSLKKQPMKAEVVERTSLQSSGSVPTPQPVEILDQRETRDSDDESDLEVASDNAICESEEEEIALSAQQHRELALEYHRRREAIASSAGAKKSRDDEIPDGSGRDRASWDKEELPIDATLSHIPPKPPISKVKASLLDRKDARAHTSITQTTGSPSPWESTSPLLSAAFGTSVLPTDTLAKSIKLGKLVDGHLVAGEDEQDVDREEREAEEIRKLLLKSMEEYSGIAAQVIGPTAKGSYWAKSEAPPSSVTPPPASTPKPQPKPSRFKINRKQPRAPSGTEVALSTYNSRTTTSSTAETPSATLPSSKPVSDVEHLSPKLTTSHQKHTSTAAASTSITPFTSVIDSPSFAPLPDNPLSSKTSNRHSPSMPSTTHTMVIDSPSFMPPSSPNVIESPFRHPAGAASLSSARRPPTVIQTPSNQPTKRRQAFVMVDSVQASSIDRVSSVNNSSDVLPRRISRFKADRSGD